MMTVPQSQIEQDIRNYLLDNFDNVGLKQVKAYLKQKYNKQISKKSRDLIKRIASEYVIIHNLFRK